MTEPLSLNKKPLGQKAKELLLKAGVTPDPYYLYVIQLAQWMLEGARKLELPGARERENAHLLEDVLSQMSSLPPQKARNLFLDPALCNRSPSGVQRMCNPLHYHNIRRYTNEQDFPPSLGPDRLRDRQSTRKVHCVFVA